MFDLNGEVGSRDGIVSAGDGHAERPGGGSTHGVRRAEASPACPAVVTGFSVEQRAQREDHIVMVGSPTPGDRRRPLFARYYAAMTARMDDEGLAALRDELLTGINGQVVEVGCGNGMNFTHYPSSVTGVRAVEPEPHLRKLAHTAATHAPVPIDVSSGTGEALPLSDKSVDTGVLCLVLCSMPDPRATVAELIRVIRPGGTLWFSSSMRRRHPRAASRPKGR